MKIKLTQDQVEDLRDLTDFAKDVVPGLEYRREAIREIFILIRRYMNSSKSWNEIVKMIDDVLVVHENRRNGISC